MKQLFEEYAEDRRAQNLDRYTLEDLGYLVRYTPEATADGIVMFSRLDAANATAMIQQQIAYFQSKRKSFEWKVYTLDEPANLQSLLSAQGFVAGAPEAFMVCSVDESISREAPSQPCEIVRVESEQGLRDLMSVHVQVWTDRKSIEWLPGYLRTKLTERPLASAWPRQLRAGTTRSRWMLLP